MKSRLEVIGEDTEWLIGEISQSFWVEFASEEIELARTVGDLFDCVLKKMGPIASPQCLTSVAFYRLRGSLAKTLGIDRRSIRPDTKLNELIPSKLRRVWMGRVETELGFRPAGLFRSSGMISLYFIALLNLVVVTQKAPVAGWLIAGVCIVIAHLLPSEFSCNTFGELVKKIVIANQGKMRLEAGGTTEKQAWDAFRQILGDASGLHADDISRSMRFPEDLGIE